MTLPTKKLLLQRPVWCASATPGGPFIHLALALVVGLAASACAQTPNDFGPPPSDDGGSEADVSTQLPPVQDAGANDSKPAVDSQAPPVDAGSPSNTAEQLCVDTINNYRKTLSLPPYQRLSSEEACAASQGLADSKVNTAHSAFGQCGEYAQNECPGWPGPPSQMIPQCLQMMWAEGPGADFSKHGHYINMSSTQYTKVACGFATASDGSIWAVQDFF